MGWAKRGIILMVSTALGIIMIGRAAGHDTYGGVNRPKVTVSTVITEDDPRWDCRTMGNGICGEGK